MAVQYRSTSTATNNSAASLTINKPTQTADGDVMIAVIQAADTTTITPPAGWLLLGSAFPSGGFRASAYKKIASSEGASWTWTFSAAATCTGSVTSFVGGHDLLHWSGQLTGTTNPQTALTCDSTRDSVGLIVSVWRNATSVTTVSASFGSEIYDISAGAASPFRGQAAYYYGPSEVNDIVNAGDALNSPNMTVAVAPTHGAAFMFLVGDKEPDDEKWSSTNGDFAVELQLDTNVVNTTGSITSALKGDVTSKVATITVRGDNPPNEDKSKLVDGLTTTKWLDNSATSYIKYDFGAGNPQTIRRYRMTSANDVDGRDPMNWTLQGSNDDSVYTTVDTRTNEAFGNRGETREFKLNGTPASYRYYKLDITSNQSGGALAIIQLAEFRVSNINVWEDITAKVLEEDKIRITRGLQGSSGRSDFSRAYVNLRNEDGRFSLLNTDSPYYGALQRNTPMRISKAYGTKTLQLQGEVDLRGGNVIGDCARAALIDAVGVVGDLDVRCDVEPKSWRQKQMLAGVAPPDDTLSAPWAFWIEDTGQLTIAWDNNAGSAWEATSTVPVPQTSARLTVRAIIDVDNGAGGTTATFYTAPDGVSGTFTQLGDPQTIGGGTSAIGYPGGGLSIGHVASTGTRGLHGLYYGFQLRNGIAGSVVSTIDFTALANGAHSWTDAQGNGWITVNNAVISNRRYRFHGEVAEWPINWDTTGRWVTAAITGAGIQKRLERGDVIQSVMRRYHTKSLSANPGAFRVYSQAKAFWPIEDASSATQWASGLAGKPSMFIYGTPVFGDENGTKFHESLALPKLNSARYGGPIVKQPSGAVDIRWIHYSPTDMSINALIMECFSTGTIKRFVVQYGGATNQVTVQATTESDGTGYFWTTGSQAAALNNELAHIQLKLTQNGANVDIEWNSRDVYGNDLGSWTFTFATATLGRVTRINPNPEGDIANTFIGHVAVYGAQTSTYGAPTFGGGEMNAHWYERAATRIERLCNEEGINYRAIGAESSSEPLGYQDADTPFNLMSSAAVSDDGYLLDPLDSLGVLYRTGRSLYNQPAALTLSYTGDDLSEELVPVQDDSYITNDFTANRGGAGSTRYQQTEGPLSVSDPPDGVGPYEDSQEYGLANDGQTRDIASWQVHKGTLDEMRFPAVNVALENLRIAASSTKTEGILKLDVGQRIDITNPPAFLPADDIRQIVIGYEETFDKFQHGFKLNTLPERIWEVAEYGQGDRFQQTDSTTYQDVTSTATSIEVVNQTGQAWSSTAAAFDIVINGERMTVTAVANATSQFSTDSFNRANSTTNLGSTDGGTVSAWTQRVGTWGINGNAAYTSATTAGAHATIPGSADFEEVSMKVTTWTSDEASIVFRWSDTNNYWFLGGTVGGALTLTKKVAGVNTTFTVGAIGPSWTLAVNDTIKARAHGSVIECFRNGVLMMTISDTFNSSATVVGMRVSTLVPRLDNFVWIRDTPRQTLTVTRAVNGRQYAHKGGSAVKLYQVPYRGV